MKELSVFCDESGDFGEYDHHSPYYIITLVFHDQNIDITSELDHLEHELTLLGLPNHCIHTGPIIRKEEPYSDLSIKERRNILNKLVAFYRNVDISYKCFMIEKKHIDDEVESVTKLSKQISSFIKEHYDDMLSYNEVKIYYDNGQVEVTKILSSVFNSLLNNVSFKKVFPSDYRLFQIADLLCTFELLRIKLENKSLSRHKLFFFGKESNLRRNYIRKLIAKEYK